MKLKFFDGKKVRKISVNLWGGHVKYKLEKMCCQINLPKKQDLMLTVS